MTTERLETADTGNVSDTELFNAALNDTAMPEAEAPQSEDATSLPEAGQARDERGRFAPKEARPEAQPEATPAAAQAAPQAKEQEQGDDARIPAWRVAEIARERNEARQRADEAARLIEQERQRAAALEARLAAMQPQEQPAVPDVFENPQAFVSHLQNQFQENLRRTEANFSLRLAHMQNGERFEKAYTSLLQAGQLGDSNTVRTIMQSPDPGSALMQWYRQRELLERTGGDLEGYEKRLREQLLNDPEFTKSVIEKVRTQAGSPQGQRPNTVTQLPPSLNRMTGSSHSAGVPDDDDATDAGLLRTALRR